ncbi:MAG TPA: tetratricopeptide repeat protein [Solirubrobacterales bacterium]|nr:tetratricopeptide repeat protein [Solirubrobacterales bacterium]
MDSSGGEGLDRELDGMLARFREEPPSIDALDAAFPDDVEDPANWPRATALLPYVDRAIASGRDEAERQTVVSLLNRAALVEFAHGRYEAALTRAQVAVQAGGDLGEIAAAGDPHRTLAMALFEYGRYDEAEEEIRRALELHGIDADPADETVREDRILLSQILSALGRREPAHEEAELALSSMPDGSLDRAGARARAQLAWSLSMEGDRGEAVTQSRQAIEEIGETWGTRHPEMVSAQTDLGAILAADGQLESSREELEAVVSLAVEILGEDHPTVDVARSMLGTTMERQGDHAAARDELGAALKHGEGVLPPGHSGLWYRNRWLSGTLESLGDREGALAHLEAAIAVLEANETLYAARLAGDLTARGKLLLKLGRSADAYESFDQARSAISGEDEAEARVRGECEIEMGRIAREDGQLTIARNHLEAALGAYARLDGDPVFDGWRQGAAVELAVVSAQIVEDLAASCRALDLADTGRTLLERGRKAFAEALSGILSDSNLIGAIAVADAASASSVPSLAQEALTRAASLLTTDKDEGHRRRLGASWHRLGRTYRHDGEMDQALAAFEAAVPLLEGDAQLRGVTLHDIAEIRAERQQWSKAIELFREAVDLKEESDDPQGDRVSTLIGLARALIEDGDPEGAAEAYARSRDILDSLPEHDPVLEIVLLEDLGDLRSREGKTGEAAGLFRRAADVARETGEPRYLTNTLTELGRALRADGKGDEALEAFEERLAILRSLPEPDPQAEGVTLHDIAVIHRDRREHAEAVALLREAAESKRRAGEAPRDLAVTLLSLGRMLVGTREYEEARAAFEEGVEVLRSLPEPDRFYEALTLKELGTAQSRLQNYPAAIGAFRQAEALRREDGEMGDLAVTLVGLGRALKGAEEYEAALATFEETLSLVDDPHMRGVALHDIANVHRARGESLEAAAFYGEAAAEKRKGDGHPKDLGFTLFSLARALRASGDLKGALEALKERLEILDGLDEPDDVGEMRTRREMAEILVSLRRPDEAVAVYEEAIERQRLQKDDGLVLAGLLLGEATIQLRLGELDDAQRLAGEAVVLQRKGPEPDRTQLSAALMVLGQGALLSDQPGEAAPLLEEANELLAQTEADPIDVAILRRSLADAYSRTDREDDAERNLEEARLALEEGLEQGMKTPSGLMTFALLAADIGAPDLVAKVIEQGRALVAADPTSRQAKKVLVDILQAVGRTYERVADEPAAAIGPYTEQLQVLEGLPQRDKKAEGGVHRDLGGVHRVLKELDSASASYRQAVDCYREAGDRLAVATCMRYLAEISAELGDHAAALATLEERIGVLAEEPEGKERTRLEIATFERMARFHLAAGDEDEARRWLEKAESAQTEGGTADKDIAESLTELRARLGVG